jgi:hypothetical protein
LSEIAALSLYCPHPSREPFPIVLANHRSFARVIEKLLAYALQKSRDEN